MKEENNDYNKKCFSIRNSLIGLLTGFINGSFGSGGGTLLVPILNDVVKIEEHKSHATAMAIIIFLTAVSSSIYIFNGTYDFKLTLTVALGSIVGGIIGAKLLCRFTGKFLRITFGIIMIIASIRMVF